VRLGRQTSLRKEITTKKIVSTVAGLVLLLAVAPLYAGSILNREMTVSVPFGFVVGDKFMRARATTRCK
jgi:hypothetical protein